MIDELGEAFDHTASIVAAVPEDRYTAPTPCPDFDVRAPDEPPRRGQPPVRRDRAR